MPVKNRLADLQPEITEWRRQIHANPELGYDLPKTTALVEAKLREFGVDEIATGIGKSGIVALIHGRSKASGRVIGLRADMDALPINEKTGVPYASGTEGKMHACGHDGHTAMLLGAAKYLAETRNFDGTVALIFQPAEEGGAGGEAMVKDGMLDTYGIEEVYALHNVPGLPIGEFAFARGAAMAATDEYAVTIRGRGGHAARPHMSIDPVPAAAACVMAMQTIVSRSTDPLEALVISTCVMRTESEATNVIDDSVYLAGTVRTLDEGVRKMARTRIEEVIEATAKAHGCIAEIEFETGYPVTVNDDAKLEIAREMATLVAGEGRVHERAPVMGAEDFSYMLNERPGAYIVVGNGENSAGLHHPEYNFNDDAIPYGTSYFAELVERRMPAS